VQRHHAQCRGQVKNNLKALQPSLAYQIVEPPNQEPKLTWLGLSPWRFNQLLGRTKKRGRPRMQSERAEENLKLFLEEAPRTRLEVREFVKDQQITDRTLARAKRTLGVRSVWVDVGKKKAVYWLLPGQLPEDVRADQLVPLETEQEELMALSEEGMAMLLRSGEDD
jgi:hypothetical protein